jgi:hypothetical protein
MDGWGGKIKFYDYYFYVTEEDPHGVDREAELSVFQDVFVFDSSMMLAVVLMVISSRLKER